MGSVAEPRGEVLRQASVALQGRPVTLWRVSERGDALLEAASAARLPPEVTSLDLDTTLGRWATPVVQGSRWVGCRLEPPMGWCLAPVRAEPAAPPSGGVERRSRERLTLELAGLCLGMIDVALVASLAPPPDMRFLQEFYRQPDLLEHLIESFPEAIVLLSNDDRVIRVNRAFAALFGYGVEEALGRRINELLVPAHLQGEGQALSQRAARGEGFGVETVRRRKDGTLVEVSILTTPIIAQGRQLGVYGIYRDITQHRRSALVLRELKKAVETMQLGVTITGLDGKIIYANPAEAQMHAWTVEELLGKDVSVLARPGERRPMTREQIRKMTTWRRDTVNVRRDGTAFPVSLLSDVVHDEAGEPVAIVTTCEEITERRRAEAQLRESEERYALAARGANDGLWDWDLVTGRLYLSPRWKAMLGYADDEIGTTPDEWLGRVRPEDRNELELAIAAHLQGASPHLEHEHRLGRKDGQTCWVLCRGLAVRDAAGRATRVAGSMTDITERKLADERLARDALHDPLTGLPNRALFTGLLKRTMARTRRSEQRRYAVLFLDLDRFKVVNDSLGHIYGDRLLLAVAGRLEICMRPGDTIARLGGDEFTVLLDDIADASDATRVADRIERELKRPIQLDGHEVTTSASIGIAFGDPGYRQPEDVIRDADLAMYRAKSQGQARYEVFDKAMHERAMSALQLEADLRRALARGEFRLFYQPIVSLRTGKISGFEALVRWQHPERGLLYPSEFIPIAEETRMIVPLGTWVLREACQQLREWQKSFPTEPALTMSVNLSPMQLQQHNLVETVLEILHRADLEPRSLKLEITEGVLMGSAERHVEVVRRLAQAGVQVLIDDFGTGHSSLSYLQRFSVATLKIDQSFITGLGAVAKNLEIVRSIISLARALGLTVVAEGVETEAQQHYLRDLQCEEVQGHLFYQPVDRGRAEELLTAGR